MVLKDWTEDTICGPSFLIPGVSRIPTWHSEIFVVLFKCLLFSIHADNVLYYYSQEINVPPVLCELLRYVIRGLNSRASTFTSTHPVMCGVYMRYLLAEEGNYIEV